MFENRGKEIMIKTNLKSKNSSIMIPRTAQNKVRKIKQAIKKLQERLAFWRTKL